MLKHSQSYSNSKIVTDPICILYFVLVTSHNGIIEAIDHEQIHILLWGLLITHKADIVDFDHALM